MKIYDIIILGGGPVGLYASFMSGYMKLDTLCIESENDVGGQPAKLYPNKYIFDFPGYKQITGQELIEKLKEQVDYFNEYSKLTTNTIIKEVAFNNENDYLSLIDSNNNIYKAKFLLITFGLGSYDFKKIESELIEDINNTNIYYTLPSDTTIYNNKDVVVLGGGDGAIDYALHIKEHSSCKSVSLIHRRDALSSKLATIEFLEQKGIKLFLNSEIQKILKNNIKILNKETNNTYEINYDEIIVQYGLEFKSHKILGLDSLEKNNNKFIVDKNYKTSNNKIFAAGSCVFSEERINMIITGISEATIALNKIKNLLPNTKKIFW